MSALRFMRLGLAPELLLSPVFFLSLGPHLRFAYAMFNPARSLSCYIPCQILCSLESLPQGEPQTIPSESLLPPLNDGCEWLSSRESGL